MKNRTIELKERWCMRNDEHWWNIY
jgi:hypothetical protein